MAVTGKQFYLLCIFFGSIPDIAVNLLEGCSSDWTLHDCVANYIPDKL